MHLCHIQGSNIHHLLFGTAKRAAKPSHPPFSHVQHLPHTCNRTLLDRSTPGTFGLLFPVPRESKELFLCETEIFLQHNQGLTKTSKHHYALPDILSSLCHTSHPWAILYCSFHRSHPISPVPFHVRGFNATALSCSKQGKELIYFFSRYKSVSKHSREVRNRAELGREHLAGFFSAEPKEAVLGRALYFL